MASHNPQSVDQFQSSLEDIAFLDTSNCSERKPQAVILHYTAGSDEDSLEELTQGAASSNYLIKSDFTIAQIVPESKRAWHAGIASWRGFSDINSLSIGVEITNWGFDGDHVPSDIDLDQCITLSGSSKKWFPFPEEQFQAIANLLIDFKDRWHIRPQFFIGHSDVSPGRKVDPGPLFPWERLHKDFGIGAWPDLEKPLQYIELPPKEKEVLWTQLRLRDYGYFCPLTGELDTKTVSTIQAFQMHFRPTKIDGKPDAETRLTLAHLVDQYHYGT